MTTTDSQHEAQGPASTLPERIGAVHERPIPKDTGYLPATTPSTVPLPHNDLDYSPPSTGTSPAYPPPAP